MVHVVIMMSDPQSVFMHEWDEYFARYYAEHWQDDIVMLIEDAGNDSSD